MEALKIIFLRLYAFRKEGQSVGVGYFHDSNGKLYRATDWCTQTYTIENGWESDNDVIAVVDKANRVHNIICQSTVYTELIKLDNINTENIELPELYCKRLGK